MLTCPYGKLHPMKLTRLTLSSATFAVMAMPAFAGSIVPLPIAGALGPIGIVGAVVVYGGYRAVKYLRKRG